MTDLQIAIKAAREAGVFLQKHYSATNLRNYHLKHKTQIVTVGDTGAEKIILRLLQKHSSYPILSEEAGWVGKQSDSAWIVDPLDGTTNFTIGSPIFAVSIALVKNNQPILACVYAPVLNILYTALAGKGAWKNGKKIKVANTKNLKQSFVTYCHGSTMKDVMESIAIEKVMRQKALEVRQLGAASVELALVASGRTDTIIIPGAHAWDVAAGVLLVREAGGKVTDFKNKNWHFGSRDMLASNGRVHQSLISAVNKL
ncbi:MAG: inositol monophosphatase family protein [Patescibacteria group bacterium]